MPQKRHAADQIVAKLRKADVDVCKVLTQFLGCNCGESVVRLSPLVWATGGLTATVFRPTTKVATTTLKLKKW